MAIGLIVAIAIFRITVALAALALRFITVLFFAPIFRRRKKQPDFAFETRGGKVYVREIKSAKEPKYPFGPNPCRQPAATPTARQPAYRPPAPEVSRNQQDCAIALKQMGYPKQQGERIAEQVAQELGPTAPLEAMVKRALQLLDRVR